MLQRFQTEVQELQLINMYQVGDNPTSQMLFILDMFASQREPAAASTTIHLNRAHSYLKWQAHNSICFKGIQATAKIAAPAPSTFHPNEALSFEPRKMPSNAHPARLFTGHFPGGVFHMAAPSNVSVTLPFARSRSLSGDRQPHKSSCHPPICPTRHTASARHPSLDEA